MATGWTARVLTIFPEMFPGPLATSLAGRALVDGLWALETVDIRAFADTKVSSTWPTRTLSPGVRSAASP